MADKELTLDKKKKDLAFQKFVEAQIKDMGASRAFTGDGVPDVQVISTGLMNLDVATGVGGWPRGTMVEIFGRESVGKTALSLLAIEQAQKEGGHVCFINLESNITKQTWLNWALKIAPGIDGDRLVYLNPSPGTEAVRKLGEALASGVFDLIVFDSIGAMSTDKELEIGGSKQAYGQSGLVTQMVKQAAEFARKSNCVVMFINQVRDLSVMTLTLEKAPGGHAKDHFAAMRLHLKPGTDKEIGDIDGEKIPVMFSVKGQLVKNKVGSPKRIARWNYWTYQSPDGILGFDRLQDVIDTSLQQGLVRAGGAWYYHDDFPDGKLQGKGKVGEFFKSNPKSIAGLRKEAVMKVYNQVGNLMTENAKGTTTEVFDIDDEKALHEVEHE